MYASVNVMYGDICRCAVLVCFFCPLLISLRCGVVRCVVVFCGNLPVAIPPMR